MASFRILNQSPQYFLSSGKVNAGGSLTFYQTDLTTLKGTWADPGMAVANTNPVLLDAAGRALSDIWGDGEYGVVLKDALGATIWTRNNVRSDEVPGTAIPALVPGEFITTDGVNLIGETILQVPDPAGFSGNQLGTDGANVFWEPKPAAVEPDIVLLADTFYAGTSGDTTKFYQEWGKATVAANSSKTATKDITFTNAFTSEPFVLLTCANANSSGVVPKAYAASVDTGGFTLSLSTLTGGTSADNFTSSDINVPINVYWLAIGKRLVA